MIIADTFILLHLPKTGGTSLNRLFRDLELPGVVVDPDNTAAKHDSVSLRESRSSWRAGQRRRFIISRRLENWLISDWNHKRRHMGLADLDLEPYRRGLFYSFRLGGRWVSADWWLDYFELDHATTSLRLEHLRDDLNQHLLPLLPDGTPTFDSLPQLNSASKTKSEDTHSLFSPADLLEIYQTNPRWAAWTLT